MITSRVIFLCNIPRSVLWRGDRREPGRRTQGFQRNHEGNHEVWVNIYVARCFESKENQSVRKRKDRFDIVINAQVLIILSDSVLLHSQIARTLGILFRPCPRGRCRVLDLPFNMIGFCTSPKQPIQSCPVLNSLQIRSQLCTNRANRRLARKMIEHVSCLVASQARSDNKATSM